MYIAYLLLGSNLGDRISYIKQAKELIQIICGNIIQQSSIYETAAWGIEEQPSFYNQAVILKTTLLPEELMQHLLNIEETIGRIRTIKYGPRIIDIDIQLIDELIINTPLLSLPHPLLVDRKFALMPLAEIAPQLKHPVLNKTILELQKECSDSLGIIKLEAQ